MTEKDVHQRVLRATAIVSEKDLGGTDDSDTFEQYEMRAAKLAEGPGTDIAMQADSDSSLVLIMISRMYLLMERQFMIQAVTAITEHLEMEQRSVKTDICLLTVQH